MLLQNETEMQLCIFNVSQSQSKVIVTWTHSSMYMYDYLAKTVKIGKLMF